MKKSILIVLSFAIFYFSCSEKSPVTPLNSGEISSGPVDTNARKVLVEEFTGVKCVNCPEGAEAIENLLAVHGEQLVAVSVHAGFFSTPFVGEEDYSIDGSEEILDLMGGEFSFPTAVINRKIFDGQNNQQSGKGEWPGFILQELAEMPLVSIAIELQFNAADRNLEVQIAGEATEAIANSLFLTVMITENNIIGKQEVPDEGIVDDYVHRHVLRAILSDNLGDQFAQAGLAKNEMFNENYTTTLSDHWVVEDCEVVAFVHFNELLKKDVLQVEAVSVVE